MSRNSWSGPVATWLYKLPSTWRGFEEACSRLGTVALEQHSQAHPWQAGRENQLGEDCQQLSVWQRTAPETGTQWARCLDKSHSRRESSLTKAHCASLPPHPQAAARGRDARKASSDEVQKEELTSLGFQNKNSYLGSEKIKKGKKSVWINRQKNMAYQPSSHFA